jgi:hypothetical protein
VSFNLLLKVSFYPWWSTLLVAFAYSAFALCIGEWETEQSKGIVLIYLGSRSTVLNMSVLIILEALVMMTFCFDYISRDKPNSGLLKLGLFIYPGFLFVLTIALSMTQAFWRLTGVNFRVVTYSSAIIVFLFIAGGTNLLRFLIKEQRLRLELLFICSFFTIILSIIFTGN